MARRCHDAVLVELAVERHYRRSIAARSRDESIKIACLRAAMRAYYKLR